MQLIVKLGATVAGDIEGHDANNGFVIPETSTLALTSNDTTVATVPATVLVPAGGAQLVTFTFVPVGTGSTDIHVKQTDADGTVFEDTATLTVEPTPIPGQVRVTLTLREVTQ